MFQDEANQVRKIALCDEVALRSAGGERRNSSGDDIKSESTDDTPAPKHMLRKCVKNTSIQIYRSCSWDALQAQYRCY